MGLPSEGSHLEDLDSSTIIYDGTATRKGASTSGAVWAIFKVTYDVSGNFLSKTWASGNQLKDKVWTHRKDGTYTYS